MLPLISHLAADYLWDYPASLNTDLPKILESYRIGSMLVLNLNSRGLISQRAQVYVLSPCLLHR